MRRQVGAFATRPITRARPWSHFVSIVAARLAMFLNRALSAPSSAPRPCATSSRTPVVPRPHAMLVACVISTMAIDAGYGEVPLVTTRDLDSRPSCAGLLWKGKLAYLHHAGARTASCGPRGRFRGAALRDQDLAARAHVFSLQFFVRGGPDACPGASSAIAGSHLRGRAAAGRRIIERRPLGWLSVFCNWPRSPP